MGELIAVLAVVAVAAAWWLERRWRRRRREELGDGYLSHEPGSTRPAGSDATADQRWHGGYGTGGDSP